MTYTIKLLKWEEYPDGSFSNSLLGFYRIYKVGVVTFSVRYTHYGSIGETLCACSTLEAAKQAAQAHWEERLKGVLEEVNF